MSTSTNAHSQAPHLPLSLSQSPLLTSNGSTTLLPSSPSEDNEPLSTVLAKRLAMPLRMLPRNSESTSPFANTTEPRPLPSFPSFTTSFASCASPDACLSASSSSCSLSFMSAHSDLSATLASSSLPALPQTTGPIPTKEIISLLDLLEKIDVDVEKEVLRVKETIGEAKLLIQEYRSEKLGIENCSMRKANRGGS